MKLAVSRAIMALAVSCMGERRRLWSAAMEAEFEAAASEGAGFRFALGCISAAGREMIVQQEGRFVLTNYVLALGLMLPMAAVQIGCALFGLPYLYPGRGGLPGAMLQGSVIEPQVRSLYQAAIPSFSFLLVVLGVGHLFIAWAMLERDWARVTRVGTLALAAAATLIIFMCVMFLDPTQALLQAGVLGIELATISVVARWHAELFPEPAEIAG